MHCAAVGHLHPLPYSERPPLRLVRGNGGRPTRTQPSTQEPISSEPQPPTPSRACRRCRDRSRPLRPAVSPEACRWSPASCTSFRKVQAQASVSSEAVAPRTAVPEPDEASICGSSCPRIPLHCMLRRKRCTGRRLSPRQSNVASTSLPPGRQLARATQREEKAAAPNGLLPLLCSRSIDKPVPYLRHRSTSLSACRANTSRRIQQPYPRSRSAALARGRRAESSSARSHKPGRTRTASFVPRSENDLDVPYAPRS